MIKTGMSPSVPSFQATQRVDVADKSVGQWVEKTPTRPLPLDIDIKNAMKKATDLQQNNPTNVTVTAGESDSFTIQTLADGDNNPRYTYKTTTTIDSNDVAKVNDKWPRVVSSFMALFGASKES